MLRRGDLYTWSNYVYYAALVTPVLPVGYRDSYPRYYTRCLLVEFPKITDEETYFGRIQNR